MIGVHPWDTFIGFNLSPSDTLRQTPFSESNKHHIFRCIFWWYKLIDVLINFTLSDFLPLVQTRVHCGKCITCLYLYIIYRPSSDGSALAASISAGQESSGSTREQITEVWCRQLAKVLCPQHVPEGGGGQQSRRVAVVVDIRHCVSCIGYFVVHDGVHKDDQAVFGQDLGKEKNGRNWVGWFW